MDTNGPCGLGETIRQARLDRGLSQQALADLLGCSAKTVGRWEAGSFGLKLGEAFRLSQILDADLVVWGELAAA